MPTYATPARAIYDRLASDLTVLAALPGGVWSRPILRSGPKATAAAFGAAPAHQQLTAAVVPDAGEDRDAFGPSAAFMAFPRIWFYADDDSNGVGRTAIEVAMGAARNALDGWSYTTTTGTGVVLAVAGRFGVREDPGDPTRLVDWLRMQADGLWRPEVAD
jgi:hypothetical protein